MNLQTAFEIIGVKEDCSLEELNEQYHTLTETKLKIEHLQEIQTAYNLILAHIYETNPKPKSSFRENLGHFFHYYKFHLIFGILTIFLIGSFANSLIQGQIEKKKEASKPPANIEIMFFGNYQEEDFSSLENRIQKFFPQWERIKLELVYAPIEIDSDLNIGEMQTSRVKLATAKPDIFILDLHHYNTFIVDGLFLPLDQLENELQTEDKWLLYQQEDDNRMHIYGIDLTHHELFTELAMASDEKIAIVRTNAMNKDNALEFLSKLLID